MLPTYKAHARQPWVCVVLGRRGSGKTYTAIKIAQAFRRDRAATDKLVLSIDSVASEPPRPNHLASAADVYCSSAPPRVAGAFSLVTVDEADLWIPEAESRRRPPGPLMDLVLRGRHRDCSLLLCTQAPSLIARVCWRLADVVIMCATTDDSDLKRISRLHGITEEHLNHLQTDAKGPRVIWTPGSVELIESQLIN